MAAPNGEYVDTQDRFQTKKKQQRYDFLKSFWEIE